MLETHESWVADIKGLIVRRSCIAHEIHFWSTRKYIIFGKQISKGFLGEGLNETDLVEKIPEEILEITLDQIVGLLNEEQRRETSNKTEQNTSQGRNTELPQPEKVFPPLQFLEPDLGPAVLPLHVPKGYFVPFIPRNAFGVVNGVSRPPHGHASFYRHRPRGLVDVRNSPAFGFLLGGP
ncbi:hypothetical protein Anas_05436 [Armadillidium nasatum]|uniref:Uncharacterized protein n=1 Tax=Armadillidium nasatum TaxID=96803 RepID=A0A5N5SI77_9CRUS|nr:hypothetical protein Anas_05436 [Armadillidium nasatum]